jgi:3-deoxy-D-arabino-heptulosonate 7-phosphate (DAHP) synthase
LSYTPIIIAGPCAAESEPQMDIAIQEAKKRNVSFLRVNLWKPRTRPGFEGLGEKGLPLLVKAAKAGLNPGLEVIVPEQAQLVLDHVLPALPKNGKLLLWIGARNQNHLVQRDIAKVAAQDKRVYLMVKNQPWKNDEHWEGILEHALSSGLAKENLLNCHRGFAPTDDNPLGLRNVPDFEAANRIREKTDIPVIFDPSHTAGQRHLVLEMGKAARRHRPDGIIVEVHHDPEHALVDHKQQLTWTQFDELLALMGLRPGAYTSQAA